MGKREQVVQIDCDGSRDAGESSEGSEVGGCYHERIEQNSFWMAPSSLESYFFFAISLIIAVERACIAPCRCFSVCLPSHASIKHSDCRGGGNRVRTYSGSTCVCRVQTIEVLTF